MTIFWKDKYRKYARNFCSIWWSFYSLFTERYKFIKETLVKEIIGFGGNNGEFFLEVLKFGMIEGHGGKDELCPLMRCKITKVSNNAIICIYNYCYLLRSVTF